MVSPSVPGRFGVPGRLLRPNEIPRPVSMGRVVHSLRWLDASWAGRVDGRGMTATEPVTSFRLRDVADVCAIVPVLLGFNPTDSIVFMGASDGQVRVCGRIGLPDLERDPLAEGCNAVRRRLRGLQVFVVGYGADADRVNSAVTSFVSGLGGAEIVRSLRVCDDRVWCLCGSCPSDGPGTTLRLDCHPIRATAVYAGLQVLADRDAVVAPVAGPAASEWVRLTRLFEGAGAGLQGMSPQERRELALGLMDTGLTDLMELDDASCALLARLVDEVDCRDACWMLQTLATANAHHELWLRVLAVCTDGWAVPVLCLLGFACWLAGQGARLAASIERAASLEPEYTMLHLLEDVNRMAVPPDFWQQLPCGPGDPA